MSVKKKPLVVVTRKLPDSIETRMRELFDARLNLDDEPMTAEQLADAARTADVLVPTVTDTITAEMLNQPDCKLRLIAHFGNGIDNIDVAAAHARGITVTNTPKVLTEDTADMTMALILAVPRRMIEGAALLTDGGEWPGWSPTWMLGRRLGGKRLGIIGMGRIGQAVARRARAFGLQIHYHNRKPVAPRIADELGATYWDSLDQMLARMDIISVNCPHTPATFHLLSARRLKLIRKDAYHRQHRARRGDRRGDADQADREPATSPAPASTSTSTSPRSIRSWCGSPKPARWCCCRTWARPPSRAASRWARR